MQKPKDKKFSEFMCFKCTKCSQIIEIKIDWEELCEHYIAWKAQLERDYAED